MGWCYIFTFFVVCAVCASFDIPEPTVQLLKPKGFKISLKDEGFSFVGFRININKPFNIGLTEGDEKGDIPFPSRGYFVYTNRNAELKPGDVIYYWVHVLDKTGNGQSLTGLEYEVTALRLTLGQKSSRVATTNRKTQRGLTSYKVDRRFSEGRRKPLNTGNAIPVIVEILGEGLCPAVDIFRIYAPDTSSGNNNGGGKTNPPSASGNIQFPDVYSRYEEIATDKCEATQTVTSIIPKVCKGTLIFSEEFGRKTLGELTNWMSEVKFPGEPDFPFNVYISDKTVSLNDGSLVITPVLTNSLYYDGFVEGDTLDLANSRCTGRANTIDCRRSSDGPQILPPVVTGKITTRHSFSFKYGKIEVRAKLPAGKWLIPEINLEPLNNAYGSEKYESGLLRIAFARGNTLFAKKLYGGPVLYDSEPFRSELLKEKIGIENWYNDYHNYSLIWKPDGIELLVDGVQYGTVEPGEGFNQLALKHKVTHGRQWPLGSIMAPLDDTFFVSLGLRVGGIHDFTDAPDINDNKPWKNGARKGLLNFWEAKNTWYPTWGDNANLKVEYVRVYAL